MTKITGTFLKAGVINSNGRMYDEKALRDAVSKFEKLNQPMYGVIGNPESPMVDLATISHRVNKVKIKHDKLPRKIKKKFKKLGLFTKLYSYLIGEIELLDTPMGERAKELAVNLVVRPMGTGTVNNDRVVEDYNLITFNLVDKDTDSYKGIIK